MYLCDVTSFGFVSLYKQLCMCVVWFWSYEIQYVERREPTRDTTLTGDKDGMAATGTLGRIEEFDGSGDWSQYAERLEIFLPQTT